MESLVNMEIDDTESPKLCSMQQSGKRYAHEATTLEEPSTQTSVCIHRIPMRLRNVNKEAYEPEMVTIGPYHWGNHTETEELKRGYMQSFLDRNPNVPYKRYLSAVKEMVERARNCYTTPIQLDIDAFAKMLVLDGSFIIELITPGREILYQRTIHGLERDLILLENQIPFFILCKLFDLNQGPGKHELLKKNILEFCKDIFPGRKVYPPTSKEVEHILDLVHSNWCPTHHSTTATQASQSNFCNHLVAQLRDAYTTYTQACIPQPASVSAQPIHGYSATEATVIDMPNKIIEDGTKSASMSVQAASVSAQPIHGYSATEATILDMLIEDETESDSMSVQAASVSAQPIHGYSAAEATVLDMLNKIIEDETKSDSMSVQAAVSAQLIHGYSATEATASVSAQPIHGNSDLIIPSAAQLRDANVKFKKREYDEGVTVFDVEFKKGVMLMPTLMVVDGTESMLRNLIAFEQYFPVYEPARVTDYALLLDHLINSSKDVQILSEQRIIENHLGSEQEVVNFVNRLTDKICYYNDNFNHEDIFNRLNEHHKKFWNRAMAVLRRDYFSSPWACLSIFAAALLLLLTIAQTYFAVRG